MSLRGYCRTLSERDRLQPGDEDDQADDQREDWPAYEKIGERFHACEIR